MKKAYAGYPMYFKYLPDEMYSATYTKNELLKSFPVTSKPSYIAVNVKVRIDIFEIFPKMKSTDILEILDKVYIVTIRRSRDNLGS